MNSIYVIPKLLFALSVSILLISCQDDTITSPDQFPGDSMTKEQLKKGNNRFVDSGESVWAYGQYSFRDQELRSILGINRNGKGQWGWIYEMEGTFGITELIAGGGDDDGTKSAGETGAGIGYLSALIRNNSLEITYSTDLGYLVNDLHLQIGCSLNDFSLENNSGAVAPGSFTFSSVDDPIQTHTFYVNLAGYNCSGNIFISAFAGKLYSLRVSRNQNTSPNFEIVDLSKYGLTDAADINDDGLIVGAQYLWDPQYGLTDMGSIAARAINNYKQVIGRSPLSQWKSYYWDQDTGLLEIDTLNYPGIESNSRAFDINDFGTVVGEVDYYDTEYFDYDFYSLIWGKNQGIIHTFESFSTAYSINNFEQITGSAAFYPSPSIYLYTIGQAPVGLGPFDGYSYGEPSSINNKGQIVGSIYVLANEPSPPIARDKSRRDFKDLNITQKIRRVTHTMGIYDFGHVVEMLKNSTFENEAFPWINESRFKRNDISETTSMITPGGEEQRQVIETALQSDYRSVAFLWDEEDGLKNLGTLGGEWSTAWDVNDHGQVVGYSSLATNQYRAFYWDKEHGMIKLPTLGGNSLARAINAKGQIVGYSFDSEGVYHPVMWKITLTANK